MGTLKFVTLFLHMFDIFHNKSFLACPPCEDREKALAMNEK